MSKGGKVDPEFQFSWIDDSYKEGNKNSNWDINF